jgi:hypothetical protein
MKTNWKENEKQIWCPVWSLSRIYIWNQLVIQVWEQAWSHINERIDEN